MDEDSKDAESEEDIFNEEQNEDKEIMESIKYAEKKLNRKMPTPVKLQSDGHSPIKYDTDIDAIQTKVDSMSF